MDAVDHPVAGQRLTGGQEDVGLVAGRTLAGRQLGDEAGRRALMAERRRRPRERRRPQPRLEPGLAALVQDPFLIPDIADLFHAAAAVHAQAGVAAVRRGAARRERRGPRPGRRDELAVAEQEADLRQLRHRRPLLLEEQAPAQRRQRVVVQRVGVEAVEFDERHVIEAHDEPAVAPGVAARPRRVADPAVEDAPVGEALAGGDRSQGDMVLGGDVGSAGMALADLPAVAPQHFRVDLGRPGGVAVGVAVEAVAAVEGRPLPGPQREFEQGVVEESVRESAHAIIARAEVWVVGDG